MGVIRRDLRFYGCANPALDDTVLAVGGAIDTGKKPTFSDLSANGQVKAVSSAAGDTTQTVTVTGRSASGAIISEVITLNGTTPAQAGTPKTFGRLLKGVKSGTTTGHVALMANTATRSNTATGGGVDADGNPYIDLDAGASATDDFYRGEIVRIPSGTGAGGLNEIIAYTGATKRAYVRNDWGTAPANGSTFEIARGMLFDKTPSEILTIHRVHYTEAANQTGGANKKSYDKVFIKNCNATTAITESVVTEVNSGVYQKEAFALATAINDSGTNGGGNNRNVAPGGLTFDSAAKNVPGGNLDVSDAIGVWLELTLDAGDAAQNSFYEAQIAGKTT